MAFSPPLSTPCFWRQISLFEMAPVWSHEPNIEVISSLSRKCLGIRNDAHVAVTFLTQGAFNKLYTISSSSLEKPYIFRVTLSVEPYLKTASEVATLKYLSRHTSIPVPQVIAYSAKPDVELGYEWILMEYLPGVCLDDIWPNTPGEKGETVEIHSVRGSVKCSPVDWKSKEDITREISEYLDQLKHVTFNCIGSLYLRADISDLGFSTVDIFDSDFVIGPLVSVRLFEGGLRARVPRNLGPYASEREHMAAMVDALFSELELMRNLDPGDPQYDKEDAEYSYQVTESVVALRDILDIVFPASSDVPPVPSCTLHHHDLSLTNVLVDPTTYKITGIVDWEATGVLPPWDIQYPQFIAGPDVEAEDEPESWVAEDSTDMCRTERWMNWEKARLRKVFGVVDREEGAMKRKFEERLRDVITWHESAARWARGVRVQDDDNTAAIG